MWPRRTLVGIVLVGVLVSAASAAETTLRLTVPERVAARAADRAAGDTTAPPPILVLEGVEVGSDEGLEITVLGPPSRGAAPPVLAVTGTVGARQAPSTRQKLTLAVPLNDEAAKLLAGRDDVSLTLRVGGRPAGHPLKFDRAFFEDP